MIAFMTWLEGSALGHAMRESGVWTYAVVNLIHILGVASLFGSVLILDLRLMGFWRMVSLSAIRLPTVRLAVIGFTIASLSGVCLLATKATEYVGNPFLYIKFVAIGAGLLNVAVLSRTVAWKQELELPLAGALSLLCWFTAVMAGRMIGYW